MFAGVGLLNQPQRVSKGAGADSARGAGDELKKTAAASIAQPKSVRRGLRVFIFESAERAASVVRDVRLRFYYRTVDRVDAVRVNDERFQFQLRRGLFCRVSRRVVRLVLREVVALLHLFAARKL